MVAVIAGFVVDFEQMNVEIAALEQESPRLGLRPGGERKINKVSI
jgi:hypothetical protein